MDKDDQSIELFNRIRNELTAIMQENNSNDPKRKLSYEDIMKPPPLPTLEPKNSEKKKKSSNKSQIYHNPQSHRQSIGGKTITMKPSSTRLSAGQTQSSDESRSSPISSSSVTSMKGSILDLENSLSASVLESHSAKSIDDDLQKMQLELGESYKLFQAIGEKFDSIDFNTLRSRIRNVRMNNLANDVGSLSTTELQKMFETRFMNNRMEKLTEEVRTEFRRHPGEFADIPELSDFFQACTQLEHGLDTLKQQRRRSNELEQRLCWATELAYDRMEEIRNSVGDKPETNF